MNLNCQLPGFAKAAATTLGLAIVLVAVLWSACKPNLGHWEKLAAATNSFGQRFVVAQEHYNRVEGWRISFWFIDADKKVYGSLLEMETGPWQNVTLTQPNQTVEVWRGAQLAGTLDLSARVFRNAMNGAIDKYLEGFDGVQGKGTTHPVFDGP